MVVADYRGLTVAEISDLRKRLRESGAELIVAKNTLTLLAAKQTGYDALEPLLAGPTALAFAYNDASKTAKAINEFNRGPKKLVVRGGMLGKDLLAADALDRVAALPSREQLEQDPTEPVEVEQHAAPDAPDLVAIVRPAGQRGFPKSSRNSTLPLASAAGGEGHPHRIGGQGPRNLRPDQEDEQRTRSWAAPGTHDDGFALQLLFRP